MSYTEEQYLDYLEYHSKEHSITLEIVINIISSIDPVYKYHFGRWVMSRFPLFKDSVSGILDESAKLDIQSDNNNLKKNASIWNQCRKFSEEKSLRMQLILVYDDVLFIKDPYVWCFYRRKNTVFLTSYNQGSGFKSTKENIDINNVFEKVPMGSGVALESKIITGDKAISISKKFDLY